MEYVWAAYSITWIAIFIYALVLGRRQSRLAEEMRTLRQLIGK